MALTTRSRLLCTTMMPLAVGIGLAAAGHAQQGCGPGCVPAAAGCNPCAAGCNPCAAAGCNPCAAAGCNPCAAGCNPCAAGCNPCAAAGCNPCAAAGVATDCVVPRAACNPCAVADGLTPEEAAAAYDCARADLAAAYSRSGVAAARDYAGWSNAAAAPYPSATHGERYVNNYYNAAASAYAAYEDAGAMPAGSVLVKDSFSVDAKGRVTVGPMFMMTRMEAGFDAGTLDWQYRTIMPDGSVAGTTGGAGAAAVRFCADCHNAAAENDALWFLPAEFRK